MSELVHPREIAERLPPGGPVRGGKVRGEIVQLAETPSRFRQSVDPDLIRHRRHLGVALDVGEDLPTGLVDAQSSRGELVARLVQEVEQRVHGRRPRTSRPANGVADLDDAGSVARVQQLRLGVFTRLVPHAAERNTASLFVTRTRHAFAFGSSGSYAWQSPCAEQATGHLSNVYRSARNGGLRS